MSEVIQEDPIPKDVPPSPRDTRDAEAPSGNIQEENKEVESPSQEEEAETISLVSGSDAETTMLERKQCVGWILVLVGMIMLALGIWAYHMKWKETLGPAAFIAVLVMAILLIVAGIGSFVLDYLCTCRSTEGQESPTSPLMSEGQADSSTGHQTYGACEA